MLDSTRRSDAAEHAPPVFAVVGQVNKGKSSIIATLAEDDRVRISPRPGETTVCQRFEVRVDGELLFTLVDTPGFEEAPAVLEWLKATSPTASERAERVRAFVAHFEGTDAFRSERELLGPILRGAGVIYVADGSRRYKARFETEMEILQWAGRPGIAVINREGDGVHVDAWRSALRQYFQVARVFNAHTASFTERIALMDTFRALAEDWAPALDRAIEALRADRVHRRDAVADVITGLLSDALTFTLEADTQADPDVLAGRFHDGLREREADARREVERLYHHTRAWQLAELERPVYARDLFDEGSWKLLGLTPRQQVVAGTLAGGVAGGTADAFVGGASFGTGLVVGGVLGGASAAYRLRDRYASVEGIGRAVTDLFGARRHRLVIGPHKNPNFPFVLLDRALLHAEAVERRAHARQDPARLSADREGASERLAKPERAALVGAFTRIRKRARRPELLTAERSEVRRVIRALLDRG